MIENILDIPENSPLYVLKNDCEDTKESKKSLLELAVEKKLLKPQEKILLDRFVQGIKMDVLEEDELVRLHTRLNIPGISSLFDHSGGLNKKEFLNIYTLYKMGKYPQKFSNFDKLAISLASRRDTKFYNHLQRCKYFKDRLSHVVHWFCKTQDVSAIQWISDMKGSFDNPKELLGMALGTNNVEFLTCVLENEKKNNQLSLNPHNDKYHLNFLYRLTKACKEPQYSPEVIFTLAKFYNVELEDTKK